MSRTHSELRRLAETAKAGVYEYAFDPDTVLGLLDALDKARAALEPFANTEAARMDIQDAPDSVFIETHFLRLAHSAFSTIFECEPRAAA